MSTTPIIPGFHPDPSICRVGDDYYIATSSFEYVPGVPIWHSRDLLTWDLIGNALTRQSQAPVGAGDGSGIYAPTLRHHDGRFWLVTTDVAVYDRGHLIVSAEDPAGPWTDPVHVTGTFGIDPDLCWDADGGCRLTWVADRPAEHRGIASVLIDPTTGEMLGTPQRVWQGTGLVHPEAPHLYRVGDWWYQLLAEGGTERGHAVTVARARGLAGPWEPAPHNPVLTHRSLDLPVMNVGHADLVQAPDGSWAMVHLGVRPRGHTPKFHTNGRETFLAGIDWVDGWPVVVEGRFAPAEPDRSFTDRFEGGALHPRWVSPGVLPESFATPGEGGLVLAAGDGAEPRLLAARVLDLTWTAEAEVVVGDGEGGLVLRLDDAHRYGLFVRDGRVEAEVLVGPARAVLGSVETDPGTALVLRIRAEEVPVGRPGPPPGPDEVVLAVVDAAGAETVLGRADGRYLSTEVAGGFTGRVVGVEADRGAVLLRRFSYRAGPGEHDRG